MKNEEFMVDFCRIAERSLDESEHRVFRFHYLLGADWKLCCRQLKMDRGNFFHMLYRVQQKLGRVFRELQPYALFPLDEYFSPSVHKPVQSNLLTMPARPKTSGLKVPLKKVA